MLFSNICSQSSQMDSFIISVADKNRTELIQKDRILIKKTSKEISEGDCTTLNYFYTSHSMSNVFITALTETVLESDTLCLETILNNIEYFEQSPNSIRVMDIINYPVLKAIYSKQIFLEKMSTYLMESDFLNDCELDQKVHGNMLLHYKYLLQYSEKETGINQENSCKQANILKIM